MAALRILALLLVALIAATLASPVADPDPGFGGGKHEHYVIHVPYHVHTIHHHHVHKEPVYVKKGWSSYGWW